MEASVTDFWRCISVCGKDDAAFSPRNGGAPAMRNQRLRMPRSSAIITACARSLACSFSRMLLM